VYDLASLCISRVFLLRKLGTVLKDPVVTTVPRLSVVTGLALIIFFVLELFFAVHTSNATPLDLDLSLVTLKHPRLHPTEVPEPSAIKEFRVGRIHPVYIVLRGVGMLK
jgi:hypothetical protein